MKIKAPYIMRVGGGGVQGLTFENISTNFISIPYFG